MRSTANNDALGGSHANEWAMDYKLNIPVHGQSVKATIDFPGAGTATIEATKLGIEQKTSDPYTFAVSAVLAGTAQGLAQGDTSVTFEQETSAKPEGLTDANGGYRFMGWFREPNVHVNRIGQDNSWFDGKTDDAAVKDDKRVEENAKHDLSSKYKADNGAGVDEIYGFKGNDLFIASYEAQVLFYNVKGETLNWHDGAKHDASVDWYRYGVGLTPAAPVDRGGLSRTATFIGWTTQRSDEAGMNGGYAAITSTALADLKNNGAFYPAGSMITVVGPADFYPVYSDYVSNIITVFEGNEQDATDNETLRDGVGNTHVDVQPGKNGTSSYTVQVRGVDNKPLSEGGTLPDGYRFLGWYENKGTDDAPLEVRVSRDFSYTLPADVDLTVPHTYIARFEYRVDYYVRAYTNKEFTESTKLCSVWNRYQTPFEENVGSTFVRENVVHWGSEHVDHGIKDNYDETCETRYTTKTLVVSPFKAYSHNVKNDTGSDTQKNLFADTDFPGAATLNDEWTSISLNVSISPVSDRYHLNFWTLERGNSCWTYVKNPIESTMLYLNTKYYVRAMITTDVNFYNKDNTILKAATRRYESNLLQNKVNGSDPTYTYYYPHVNTSVEAKGKPQDGLAGSYESPLTLESSPTDAEMAVPGYKFLGWISTAEVPKDSDVWNYIYDVKGDSFTTSDQDKAAPYLATEKSVVTQWQDAYPVYAKYNVSYTTNLHRAGFDGTSEVNVPKYDITPTLNADTDPATATVTPDIATTVYKSGDELYKLDKVEIELPNGEVKELESNGDNSYSYSVEPGGTYTFVAYYSPLAVVYHLNATDVDGKVAQRDDTLGSLKDGIPLPTYKIGDIDDATGKYNVFVGWTETKPAAGGYVVWSDGVSMVNKNTVVKTPMELYPVYRPSLVTVQSNIDSNLANPDLVRSLGRTDSGDQISLEVKAAEEVEGTDGIKYDFVGWSSDYNKDNHSYTLMTEDKTYFLDGNEPFREVTYTAIYKPTPLKVRYHDTDGKVIYTATVDPNDTKDLRGQDGNAGFVHTAEVPKMDESGNPVYDDKGDPVTEPKEAAYDDKAYSAIVAFLDEQADSSLKELFLEWQWINGDTAVPWSDFKGKPVKGDMDLYPVTYKVVANDTSDTANPKNVTGQLKWLLDPNAANTVDGKSDKAPFKACFAKPFMGTQLTVHVDRVGYGLSKPTSESVNEKYVSLYSSGSGEGSFDLTNRLDFKLTGADAQGDGNAVFDFAATHTLKIVKQTQDSWAKGKTFRFKVSRADMDGKPLEERLVEVTVSPDAQLKDGSAWYSGAIELAVPAGIYTVEEDSAWAWRYSSQIGVPGNQPGDKAQATISAASSVNDATFTCTNTRVKDKWIDGSDCAHNVWSNGNVAKKGD